MIKRKFFIFFLGIVTIFLIGCIEYHDIIYLNNNGSGKFEYTVTVDSSSKGFLAFNNKDKNATDYTDKKERLSAIEGISSVTITDYRDSTGVGYKTSFYFNSLASLDSALNEDNGNIRYHTSLDNMGENKYKFSRKIVNISPKDKKISKDNSLSKISDGFMQNVIFHYQLKVSGNISSFNNDTYLSSVKQKEGYISWSVSYKDISSQDVILFVEYTSISPLLNNPSYISLLIAGIVALLFIVGYFIFLRN